MDKLENKLYRKFGRYAVKNLSLILIMCYMAGYVISFVNSTALGYLTLDPWAILHGQVWRIFTWILIPPGESNLFFILIMLFFYYSIGTALERTWGTWRYNVYIFSGMFYTVIAAFVMLGVLTALQPVLHIGMWNVPFNASNAQPVMAYIARASFSTYYVNMSIFLAFAATFPEARVLLMFFIPVKVKWLGFIYAAMLAYDFVVSPFYIKVTIAAALLNFIIFYFRSRSFRRFAPSEMARRREYRKSVSAGQQAAANNAAPEKDAGGTAHMHPAGASALHRCTICGRTEKDSPDLDFRYCSRCAGSHEYCQDHLFTHVHITGEGTAR